jgi:aminocarboxymuconate-semialdehyde decarboxylase
MSTTSSTGLVDVHTHAIPPELPALPPGHDWPSVRRAGDREARILTGDRWYRDIDDRCWSVPARLRDMDAEGVDVQFVSPIPVTLCHGAPADGARALARAQNDFFATMVAEAPDRLRALGAVPLQDPESALEELRRCVLELGFAGVEIGTRVGERELMDPSFAPFFDAAEELGALVFVHPVDGTVDPRIIALGLTFGLGMPGETAIAGAGLLTSDVLARRPGLRICLAHGAGSLPSILPRLELGEILRGKEDRPPVRSLYCDSLTYDVSSLLLAVHRFGAEHVLLGTDYPFSARENPAGKVLSEAAEDLRDAIGGRNARALLGEVPAGSRR